MGSNSCNRPNCTFQMIKLGVMLIGSTITSSGKADLTFTHVQKGYTTLPGPSVLGPQKNKEVEGNSWGIGTLPEHA